MNWDPTINCTGERHDVAVDRLGECLEYCRTGARTCVGCRYCFTRDFIDHSCRGDEEYTFTGSMARDARFPPDTKRVATWSVVTESGAVKSGAWGAPPTQLWEIDALGKRLVQQHPQSVVVDLDAREDGVVFVGWRGRTKGLWRVEPQGEAKLIIPDIEPWQIVAEGRNVWVATIANGLGRAKKDNLLSKCLQDL